MSTPSDKNPFGYRWLWLQTITLAFQGLGRVGWVLADIPRYNQWVDIPLALYLSVWAVWGVLFAKLTWGIWRRRRWAIRSLWYILAGYAMFAVGWLRLYATSPYDRQRLPFIVGSTILVLFVDWLIIRRRPMQSFFIGANNDY